MEKRLADRTVALYTLDLDRLQRSAQEAGVALRQVRNTHIRRWVAQMHSGGRSARGIALILSGWRGLYVWLGRQGLMDHNPVQDVRAPKAGKPLPKALGVDESVQLASHVEEADPPGLEARDRCITELLYGCGLRIGELVGLDVAASASARGWIDRDAGEAHVLGKGVQAAQRAGGQGGPGGAGRTGWPCAAPGRATMRPCSSAPGGSASRRSTSACASNAAPSWPA